MFQPPDRIRHEFDQIAPFSSDGWTHNNHYHPFLLKHLPPRIESALDVGCGVGTFSRLLAARAERVLGLDLSPEMIRIARERSTAFPNIEYQVADVLQSDFAPASFDCIASIATLHHMALNAVLPLLANALKPGGTLLILDLYQAESTGDLLYGALGIPVGFVYGKLNHHEPDSEAARQAWEEHGSGDNYTRISDVRRVARDLLPGAQIRKHVLWRYSLVWRKP
jgi:SAM-dependent methyltransferase